MRESWKYEKLGNLCKTGAGGTPLKSKKEYYENGNIPWLRSGEVNNRNIVDCELKITEDGLNNSSAKIFPPRTVLIAMYGATAGQVGILNFECSTNQAVCGILPNELFIPEFLYYRFLAGQDDLIKQAVGGAQPNISQEKIKNTLVPKLPLPEQKQIVAILDKAFAAIDQAKANIEKNIDNAKELFQSKLNEIFSQKGEGWEEKKLVEVTSKIGSGATPKGGQATYKESGISLIRSMNVHDDGFREKNLAFIDEEQASKLNNVTIEENDVLLNITGASVARCCIVDNNYLPARVNQHVSIIRLKNGILNPEFLHYALTSKQTKNKLLGIGEQGSTRQAITKTQIENFEIMFPENLDLQTELVYSLNEIRNKSEKLIDSYELKISSLEELKKSILQKAFSGELTKDFNESKIYKLENELGQVAESKPKY
jgi:type I restriction enzyme S subunit